MIPTAAPTCDDGEIVVGGGRRLWDPTRLFRRFEQSNIPLLKDDVPSVSPMGDGTAGTAARRRPDSSVCR